MNSVPPTHAPKTPTTILLVDDDPFMLRLMDLILRDAGYDIIQAHSGEEALKAIRERQTVDLVIADVVMPGMTRGVSFVAVIFPTYLAASVISAFDALAPSG